MAAASNYPNWLLILVVLATLLDIEPLRSENEPLKGLKGPPLPNANFLVADLDLFALFDA